MARLQYQHLNNGIYQHEVNVHQQQFVDSVHADIHTETIERLWLLVGTIVSRASRSALASYIAKLRC